MYRILQAAARSLKNFNYRIWAAGALISNVGTWMQRTAQDWLVLTQLTNENATAVGIVMSLQFGPALVLLPLTGYAADHFDRRKLLLATQAGMGLLACGLGLLTLLGHVALWHVYGFALLLGIVTAFDAPARQTFVSELVEENDLANAVALNSMSFNIARMIGPALAGVLIAAIGSGWVFLANGLSYLAVIASLALLRRCQLHGRARAEHSQGGWLGGFHYVMERPDLQVVLFMLFLLGTFGLNFPIFITSMSVSVFHLGAREYGILASAMAIGSVAGALLSAARARPSIAGITASALVFGLGCAVAALAPAYWMFGAVLVLVGVAAQIFTTSTNSVVQLSTDPAMRGRVMAILMAIFLGATPLGAPLVGWVADTFGPRWALAVAAASGVLAALAGLRYVRNGRVPQPATGSQA